MKVIAMYLPQFHRVKENDEWWGEGFTDWVSTKNAVPLYEGHYQPHVPLNENYYDLSEKSAMIHQAELMHQFGIDGICIYHYWFKDGKRILEKPAENLLRWTDINMPFCFYWANETWARSWSNIRGSNVWSDAKQEDRLGKSKAVLLEQTYGDEKDWEEHFNYLLPFFKDPRYIKIDGKPIFMIYKTREIPCLREMLQCWRKLAKNSGIEDLYFIGAKSDAGVTSEIDAFMCHEPAKSMHALENEYGGNDVIMEDYSEVWDRILATNSFTRKTFFSGFVGYDDTPRRGLKGTVIQNASPALFEHFLTELLAKNEAADNEFTFLNAWNEWGEGMHLEPDEKYGTEYLEAVNRAKQNYVSRISFYKNHGKEIFNDLEVIQKKSDKFERYLNLLDDWMSLREKGVWLGDYLLKQGYNKVAIYGYGVFGRHLLEELKNSKVEVVGVVDKRNTKLYAPVELFYPTGPLPDFDVMIVSAYFFMEEILNELGNVPYKIISIETVILESSV